MDFGKILDDWDDYQRSERKAKQNQKSQPAGAGHGPKPNPGPREAPPRPMSRSTPRQPSVDDYLSHWLVMHGTEDKDSEEPNARDDRQVRIRNSERLHRMSPQAVVDLHGKTAAEAEADLDRFLAGCSRQGMEKVLVIHGKGNHSANEGIMTDLVRRVLENSDFAAGFGFEDRQHGGRGATWVILKGKDYFSR